MASLSDQVKSLVGTGEALVVPGTQILPDNRDWTNRFEIRSHSSSRIYVISQHALKRFWGCSCPAWRTRRRCKHLDALGLPGGEKPYEASVVSTAKLDPGSLPMGFDQPIALYSDGTRKIMFAD